MNIVSTRLAIDFKMEEEVPETHQYFDKVEFLNKCQKVYAYTAYFRFRFGPTLLCKNITLKEDDIISFKFEDFHITREENVVFEGCNLGPVNCDFFRQFPTTKNMLFYNCTMEFRPSMLRIENNTLQTLAIHSSKVRGNRFTNALQALPNLKVLVFFDTELEHGVIDSDLLKAATRLEDITFAKNKTITEIEENAFDNLVELKSLYLSGLNLKVWSPRLIEKCHHIQSFTLYEPLESFPEGLPDTIKDLSLTYTLFKTITRAELSRFKHLETLSICQGHLEDFEEDTFDDLKELMYLNFNTNKIRNMSTRNIKFCKRLQEILLVGNPMRSFCLMDEGKTVNIKLGL